MSERAPEGLLPALAGLGGFFELTRPAEGSDAVPWSEVLAHDALLARTATVRAALARSSGIPLEDVDTKVAVSALQVGLASRLWSVAMAGAVLHRWVPDLGSDNLVASPGHGGPVPLALADPSRGYAVRGTPESARVLGGVVVEDSLAALDAACARVGPTSSQVLRSNSASSLVGAARVLGTQRPEDRPSAWALARAVLEHPGLARGGRVRERAGLPEGVGGAMERPREAFLRHGCCLFDRLPQHGLCPDCVRAEHRPDLVTPGH
ncbi:hypothetical protein SGUI_0997 [Serinicoccus hydrothermalis]|uniref:Ferric siderophore reductase C-terminal domain-containing protein n=1 Tax=Serinicoccus hydrothermalis TaxID=1758689 RepID=A0A1B1NAD0_9MICO|nr:(2Fe-2S)-binding protein [Serinicoccus hydrothermalis]ANS78393.1 hypothetical protein SGUI_0997 [Serinicoccus hydrothermalis]